MSVERAVRGLAGWLLAAISITGGARAELSGWVATRGPTERYAVVDALFMQRDNGANPTALVVDGDTLATQIAADDLQFPVAPGLRVLLGRHGPDVVGWELGYVGVYGMFADASAAGAGNLEVAPPLSSLVASLRDASLARATYGSVLNMAEANLACTERYRRCVRQSGYEFERVPATATVDWLAGFRWAGLDESAALVLAAPGVSGDYALRTSSNLFGGQIGARGRLEWRRWAAEGWLKAALAGSALAQSQDPIVDTITGDVYREGVSSSTGTVGGIFDLAGALVYRIDDTWALRFGYGMVWLTGVALAPDQFDFSASTLAGRAIDGNSTLWLGGGSLGLEARW